MAYYGITITGRASMEIIRNNLATMEFQTILVRTKVCTLIILPPRALV
jgi:hypothetical protein